MYKEILNVLKKNLKASSSAFTLVELLLVVALLGLSLGVTTDILLSVTKSYNKTQVLNEIEQQANFVSLKMTKELRTATNIYDPTTDPGDLGTTLRFLTRSGDEIKYYIEDGVIYRQVTVLDVPGTTYQVTSPTGIEGVSVICTDKCFTLISENPDIITFSLVFKKPNLSPLSTLNTDIKIEDTIVLRGTY